MGDVYMFCYNCGAKIVDYARFCQRCGAKQPNVEEVERNLEETIQIDDSFSEENTSMSSSLTEDLDDDETPVGKIFSIGSYELVLSPAEYQYIVIRCPFLTITLRDLEDFSAFRRENVNSFDDIFEKSLPKIVGYLDEAITFFVDHLLVGTLKITDIDAAGLKDQILQRVSFEELFEDLISSAQEIQAYTEQLGYESNAPGPWVGGGFGFSGAIKGAVMAVAMNIGTSALFGLGKIITGNTDEQKIARLKKKHFDELGDDYELVRLHYLLDTCFFVTYDILMQYYAKESFYPDTKKASAICNNTIRALQQKSFSRDQAVQALLNGLHYDPTNTEIIKGLLYLLPEAELDLETYTTFCGMSLVFAEIVRDFSFKKKYELIRRYTDAEDVLEKIDQVACNQYELDESLKKKLPPDRTYYLLEGEYTIPTNLSNVCFIGLGEVVVHVPNGTIPDFENRKITFRNITFSDEIKDYFEANALTEKALEKIKTGHYIEALSDLLTAHSLGNGDAVCLFGWLMANGLGCERDTENAKKYFDEGEALGTKMWQVFGVACATGTLGAELDYKKAVYWLEKDSDLTADNLFLLGDIYERGLNGDKNPQKARSCYHQAYTRGNTQAMVRYAMMDDNLENRKSLLEEAASKGGAEAEYQLGVLHSDHYEVFHESQEEGLRNAAKHYQKAAQEGIPDALYRLGISYIEGNGITQSERLAADCFQKASQKEHVGAMLELGVCYANGTGIQQDYTKAVDLYERVAETGNAEAKYNLGLCYQYGAGVEKNLKKAVALYKEAMDCGNEDARNALLAIRDQMISEKKG